VAELVDAVAAALALDDPFRRDAELRRIASAAFADAWEGDERDSAEHAARFSGDLSRAWQHTTDESSAVRIADMITIAARNAAALAAMEPGMELEWITRRDDLVRELHVPMDGQRQRAGQPFLVGGFPLLYPGQPVGPPEVWINCRCSLSPAAAAEAVPSVAAAQEATMTLRSQGEEIDFVFEINPDFAESVSPTHTHTFNPSSHAHTFSTASAEPVALVAVSDKPWSQFTAADYTIEQWRRACLLKMPGGDPDSKSTFKLPVREPNGTLNRNGVHAAAAALAGARGGVDAPAGAKEAARRKLRGLYRQLGEEAPESLAADLTGGSDALVAVDTHDAPGWVTNPRETQRLRNYWTKGAGAAKIAWGAPGDFDRCRKQLAKYVAGPYLAGTCANLHYVALGYWPGQGPHASGEPPTDMAPEEEAVTTAFIAAATETEEVLPPLEWFSDPGFGGPQPLTIDDDGHIYGHAATFGVCHMGYPDQCVEAPRSERGYSHFRTGAIRTTGGVVSVGQITMDTGHPPLHLSANDAIRHYDDTGTVVADVAAGEDAHGIWLNGMMRPGVGKDKWRALQAASISGDWRPLGGKAEFVAALAVNVPGFPIPRPELLVASAGTAMVAVGVVNADGTVDAIAAAVVRRLDEQARRRQRIDRLTTTVNALRIERMGIEV
jgi:hypothetical protein